MALTPEQQQTALERIKKVAALRGGKYISNGYVSSENKAKFSCAKGHTWEAGVNNVFRTSWCPECYEALWRSKLQSLDGLKAAVEDRKWTVVSKVFTTDAATYTFTCPNGHTINAKGSEVRKQGFDCPECRDAIDNKRVVLPVTDERCKDLAESKGLTYISKELRGVYWIMKVTCPTHGEFDIMHQTLDKGTGCPECYHDSLRLTMSDVKTLAESKGYQVVDGQTYCNNHTPIKLICPTHGEFAMTYGNLQSGCGCKQCGQERRAAAQTGDMDYVEELAAAKNYTVVPGQTYVSSADYINFVCDKGHTFKMIPNALQQHRGCPHCAGNAKISIEGLASRAELAGYTLVPGQAYTNSEAKYKFSCAGHGEFVAAAYSMRQGVKSCPACSVFRMEHVTRTILEALVNKRFPLVNNLFGDRLQLDMYNSDIQLACEYQGRQHFEHIPFFQRTEEDFQAQLERDERKRQQCKDNGIRLIEVPYTVPEHELEQFLIDKLTELGISF